LAHAPDGTSDTPDANGRGEGWWPPPSVRSPPRGLVYAAAGNLPIAVCRDARLRGEDRTHDETYGQRGWQWGINFGNFQELALALTNGKTATPPHTCGNYSWDCDPARAGGDRNVGDSSAWCP